MSARRHIKYALISALLLSTAPLHGQIYGDYDQDLTVTPLGEAQVFDPGIAVQGAAMDPTQWNGTSMSVAMAVIAAAPEASVSAATEDMVARTLLSGGVPPQGAADNADYFAARLGKLVALGRTDNVNAIMGRAPDQADTPQGQRLSADKALTLGDNDKACLIADRIEEARSQPYWAKLRAFCHVKRGEIPAAELTADVLRRSGHEAPEFYKALLAMTGIKPNSPIQAGNDPLLSAMAATVSADAPKAEDAKAQLGVLIADAGSLTREEFGAALAALALTANPDDAALGGGFFDVDATIADDSPASWGKLYGVVKSGTDAGVSAKAAGALLTRAQEAGIFYPIAKLIQPHLSVIPQGIRAQSGREAFARLAVFEGDLGAIRALYDATPDDDPFRARLALASDALGNGFMLGSLGNDMTQRLSASGAEKSRAIRDSYVAVGLGASLSDEAAIMLADSNASLPGRSARPGALLALRSAAAKNARAETALRAAAILGEGGPTSLRADSLSHVLSALMQAGLIDVAGRIAAEDFLITP